MLEANYHIAKRFSENLIVTEMKKNVLTKKLVYLGLSILDNKISMYQCWYDNKKRNYGEITRLCYRDTDNFITEIKTQEI